VFHKQLDKLLDTAAGRGLVDPTTADALRALAREEVRERGVLTLAGTLAWLGGGAVIVGIILLVAANWDSIPDMIKLGGFLALLAGTHAVGFRIRQARLPLEKTAEAFHFIGAGLFLAGVGLVAQIYHLDARPPNGILLWLVAIAPLAFLLRSVTITTMTFFALLLWAHMEGFFSGSPVEMQDSFAAHLALEVGLGVGLIGFSGALKGREPGMAATFRGWGTLLLFYGLYCLGFYRHFSESYHEARSIALPCAFLGLGAVGMAVGWRGLSPESAWLRNRLGVLLGATLLLSAAAFAADAGFLPRGPSFEFMSFGWNQSFDLVEWVLSTAAWAVWFLLALWSIAWGARADKKGFVNLGVGGFGIGIITRFFDLMGGMSETGLMFVIGGGVLLATGFAMEKWRRRIVRRMEEGRAA
jgi:hypothetical protein